MMKINPLSSELLADLTYRNGSKLMESIDWMTLIPVGLAIAIFVGGMLMMFSGIWTSRNR